MTKPQYGILRFAKYKGPEISRIEAHNERTKEIYASNPNVDTERSKYNFHLVKPNGKYRAEAEKQIAEVGCRTRTDSVRVVETLKIELMGEKLWKPFGKNVNLLLKTYAKS